MNNLFKKAAVFTDIHFGLKSNSLQHNQDCLDFVDWFILKAKEGKIEMLTDGKEERQFLHAEDCSRCLRILSEKYDDIDRDANLHITNFGWNTILEVAEIINESIPCEIIPSTEIDTVQLNKRNEPDTYILNFWKPEISLRDGIEKIIKEI